MCHNMNIRASGTVDKVDSNCDGFWISSGFLCFFQLRGWINQLESTIETLYILFLWKGTPCRLAISLC